jgi:uncharacterized protein (TIGR02001 family)
MRKSLVLTAVLAALASQAVYAEEAAAPAAAAAAETPTWTFPATMSFVSDYIWHGQSQTWGNPAAQFGIEVDHKSGFYAGFWASNVSAHWLPNANLETDWSVGYRGAFATDFKYDIGGVYVYYPDGNFKQALNGTTYSYSKLDTAELYGNLGWKWFNFKVGYEPTKFYGWTYENSGANNGGFANCAKCGIKNGDDSKNSYYYVGSFSYDVPQLAGLNLAGEVGRHSVGGSTGLDWTWYKVGATKSFDGTLAGWSVNAFYTGTTGSDAYKGFASLQNGADHYSVDQSKVVVGITKAF